MKAQYIVAWLRHHNLAFVTAVNELMTRNSPPKLGGEPARTKSEQAGWFPCRYWQLREPPRPRLRSGTPPNLGGECPHSIVGGHRPPLQMKRSHHPFLGSVLCLLCTFPDLLGKAATLLKNVLQRELHNPRIQRISDLPESVDGQAESEYRSSSRDECRTKTVGHV